MEEEGARRGGRLRGGGVLVGVGCGDRRVKFGLRKEVAGGVWTMRDEGEDFGYQALLHARVLAGEVSRFKDGWCGARGLTYELRVEFRQPRLTSVVEDEDSVNHAADRSLRGLVARSSLLRIVRCSRRRAATVRSSMAVVPGTESGNSVLSHP